MDTLDIMKSLAQLSARKNLSLDLGTAAEIVEWVQSLVLDAPLPLDYTDHSLENLLKIISENRTVFEPPLYPYEDRRKITAIKDLRALTNASLKESKDAVDQFCAISPWEWPDA